MKRRLLITSAQNETKIDVRFWETLKTYARETGADILVLPFIYHPRNNPTVDGRTEKSKLEWDSHVTNYFPDKDVIAFKNWRIHTSLNILPTKQKPLTGLDSVSGSNSIIVPHTKRALESALVFGHRKPKLMTTSMACTVPNYSRSTAGWQGKRYHTIGAVELIDHGPNKVEVNHLVASKDGSFIRNTDHWTKNGCAHLEKSTEALILGDLHLPNQNTRIWNSTLDLVNQLRPEKLVLHDILDNDSISHWMDSFEAVEKRQVKIPKIIEKAANYLLDLRDHAGFANIYVAASNHDYWLRRWVDEVDWRTLTTENALVYFQLASELLIDKNANLTESLLQQYGIDFLTFLTEKTSLTCKGHELSMHGHIGTKGSRGSTTQFNKLSASIIHGHTHTPVIDRSVISVGTTTNRRREYEKGPISSANTHAAVKLNGKVELIFL